MANLDNDLSIRERILNSLEILFAEFGLDGVSPCRITHHAGVELALANYYFGSKIDLFFAVVQRRTEELNAARTQAI